METPDITLMQKLVGAVSGLIVAVIGLVQAFGVAVSIEQSAAILGLWAGLGGVAVLADAIIRNGRSKVAATQLNIDFEHYTNELHHQRAYGAPDPAKAQIDETA